MRTLLRPAHRCLSTGLALVTLAACSANPSDADPGPANAGLDTATAIWLTPNTIAWPGVPLTGSYRLYFASGGGLVLGKQAVLAADDSIALQATAKRLPADLAQQFAHWTQATVLTLDPARTDLSDIKSRLKGQIALVQLGADGKPVLGTSLQLAPLLDTLFAGQAGKQTLGFSVDRDGMASFRLWAPTAKAVRLNIDAGSIAMTEDDAGVWTYSARRPDWINAAYYSYDVTVLSRAAGNRLVTNTVTDPYSVSLSADSRSSFAADLDSAALKPAGWAGQPIPGNDVPVDFSIYELHIRDFSSADTSVPAAHRGKYLAFTDSGSQGMQHLRRLQQAGLTHIHLLPAFDMSSVNETGCVAQPDVPVAPADAQAQQQAVWAARAQDCYNWGYDPWHFTAPEGSYATDAADGRARVIEFRQMVQSLHATGLRTVMDVVYNHTAAGGQGKHSVLDRIVPGYYHRLGAHGEILSDSCCADTAPEHAMMGRLMIDSVNTWARHYRVDGFRFDLMGFMPRALMLQLQTEVNAAAGRPIYLYGEAWNFGAASNDQRFVQARQAHIAGSGIGAFNDRLRDAVRGGGPFDKGDAHVRNQGFATGLFLAPNDLATASREDLLYWSDMVRLGLAASLRDYPFTDAAGRRRPGRELVYGEQAAGFAQDPAEVINYVDAHDNETLFDAMAYKLPRSTGRADRLRYYQLALALNMLAQGVPFFQAGSDIQRSKSMDRDSYDSGDWFNRIDWSAVDNYFGSGLPPAASNRDNWTTIRQRKLLTDSLIKPQPAGIAQTRDYFADLLTLRRSTTLLRLRTGQDIRERLRFYNTGPSQVPGVVALSIDGTGYAGAGFKTVVLLFNADRKANTVTIDPLKAKSLRIHPVLARSTADTVSRMASYAAATGSFALPPLSTVVFVEN